MGEVINISTGKELLDSGITKFEVMNGAWIGEVDIRNNQPHLYCRDYNDSLVNSYPIHNNTKLDLIIRPLSYESLSEKCKNKPVHALVKFQEKQLEVINRIGEQLKLGYLNMSETYDTEEIAIIKKALSSYKKRLLRGGLNYENSKGIY